MAKDTTTTLMSKGTRKSLISRTLERCKSGLSTGKAPAPSGCFSVYVGPERERFVVRTECANHPLFQRLLDDAEREYGYAAQGPLALPCSVDAFLDVLWEMEHSREEGDAVGSEAPMAASSPMCGLVCSNKGRAAATAGYRLLSPARVAEPSPFSRSSTLVRRRR